MRVSVVVPTYRRPELLARCLSALTRQTLDGHEFEIVVADDAAIATTQKQVAEWSSRSVATIRYVAVGGIHGPASARNSGWLSARADLIAFTDDDTVPDAGWLEKGLLGMSDPELVAASGCVQMPISEVPTDYERNESGLCDAEFVTANCFVRRNALEAIGGFDERFSMAWREDSDLHFSLMQWALPRGLKVGRIADAIIVHPVRAASWGISLSQQKKSLFNALLYKKHPELYRSRIQALPPIHYYFMVLSLVFSLLMLLTESYALAFFYGWVWLMLTTSFAMRRLSGSSWRASHILEMLVTSALIPPLAVYWRVRGGLRFGVFFF